MNDINNLSDTIKPKSDQLNADDLLTGPITITVKSVGRGSVDQPVAISADGIMPYKPCKTMRRVLIAAWGVNGSDWIGKSMTLYCDPSVKFGGVALGGIRISHVSDIKNDLSMMLTTTRSKRAQYTVKVLSSPASGFVVDDTARGWIDAINAGTHTLENIEDPKYRALIKSELER
jgi:hypothetical protein